MEKIKINYWEVKGYRGKSDYDGPEDNNFNHVVAVDSRLSKDDVLNMMFNKFKDKYRVVVLSATLWKTTDEHGLEIVVDKKDVEPIEHKCTTLEEFAKVHCEHCGTQRCGGINDEEMREGCDCYRKEILGQPTLHEIIEEINKQNTSCNI